MPDKYRLKRVKPSEVDYADFNPRGETAEDIQRDRTFQQLKDSVYQYGVLVPIVVHRQARAGKKPYRLVDGERRLRAALETKVDRIPAHVATGADPTHDLVEAFHIHMLRKQWTPIAQARALKRLMEELHKRGQPKNADDLLEELRTRTGCTNDELKRLRRAIRFPDSVLQSVEKGELGFSHLVQIEESFVEQIDSNFPELRARIPKKAARQALVDKAKTHTLSTTRALMENIVPVIMRAKQGTPEEGEYAQSLLESFVNKPEMSAEDVLRQYDLRYPPNRDAIDLGKAISDLAENLCAKLPLLGPHALDAFPKLAGGLKRNLRALKQAVTKALQKMERGAHA